MTLHDDVVYEVKRLINSPGSLDDERVENIIKAAGRLYAADLQRADQRYALLFLGMLSLLTEILESHEEARKKITEIIDYNEKMIDL